MSNIGIKEKKQKLEASRARRRDGDAAGRSALAGILADTGRGAKITAHNGLIAIVYGLCMFLVFYVALQVAFYGVAFLSGTTGAFAMETAADVLTVYVIVAMVCGFCMFFSFGIEKALIRAMKRRFWKSGKDGGIDRGDAWRERHDTEN